jgi:hypothetical protein
MSSLAATTHVVSAFALLGRVCDLASTRIGSPTLLLESNSAGRRYGWRFAWLSLILALVPYLDVHVGIAVAVASLLAAAHNFSRAWLTRGLGECEHLRVLQRAAVGTTPAVIVALNAASGLMFAACGILVWLLSGDETAAWTGVGMITYGAGVTIHGTGAALRVRRCAARTGSPSSATRPCST